MTSLYQMPLQYNNQNQLQYYNLKGSPLNYSYSADFHPNLGQPYSPTGISYQQQALGNPHAPPPLPSRLVYDTQPAYPIISPPDPHVTAFHNSPPAQYFTVNGGTILASASPTASSGSGPSSSEHLGSFVTSNPHYQNAYHGSPSPTVSSSGSSSCYESSSFSVADAPYGSTSSKNTTPDTSPNPPFQPFVPDAGLLQGHATPVRISGSFSRASPYPTFSRDANNSSSSYLNKARLEVDLQKYLRAGPGLAEHSNVNSTPSIALPSSFPVPSLVPHLHSSSQSPSTFGHSRNYEGWVEGSQDGGEDVERREAWSIVRRPVPVPVNVPVRVSVARYERMVRRGINQVSSPALSSSSPPSYALTTNPNTPSSSSSSPNSTFSTKPLVEPSKISTPFLAQCRPRKHRCTDCEKSFDRPSTLRKHMLVHTGEKAFECQNCGRRFGVLSNLNRHARRCNLKAPSNSSTTPATATTTSTSSSSSTEDGATTRASSAHPSEGDGDRGEGSPAIDESPTDIDSTSPPSSLTANHTPPSIPSPTTDTSMEATPQWIPPSLQGYNLLSNEYYWASAPMPLPAAGSCSEMDEKSGSFNYGHDQNIPPYDDGRGG